MNKNTNKQRGEAVLALLLLTGIVGVGGVYVYQHDSKIKQLSENDRQLAASVQAVDDKANLSLTALNVAHSNRPELFARMPGKYQAPSCEWMKDLTQ